MQRSVRFVNNRHYSVKQWHTLSSQYTLLGQDESPETLLTVIRMVILSQMANQTQKILFHCCIFLTLTLQTENFSIPGHLHIVSDEKLKKKSFWSWMDKETKQ